MLFGNERYGKMLQGFLAQRLWIQRERNGIPGSPERDWEEARRLLSKRRGVLIARFIALGDYLWRKTGFSGKTLWDAIQTVGLPLTVLLISNAFSYTSQMHTSRNAIAQKNIELAKEADAERQKFLDSYLLQMMSFVEKEDPLDCHKKEFKCQQWKKDDTQFLLARLKTIVALQILDPRRQQLVIQFLQSSGLNIGMMTDKGLRYGLLDDGNLARANLRGADLEGLHLDGVDLQYANLEATNLVRTSLKKANLKGANLSDSRIERATLVDANLEDAYLFRASLVCTRLSGANLKGARLNGAKFYETDPDLQEIANKCPEKSSLKQTSDFSDADNYDVDSRTEILKVKDIGDAVVNNAELDIFLRTRRGRREIIPAKSLVQPLRYPWEKPYAREQPTILADRTTVLKPYGKVLRDKFSDGNTTIEGVGISGDNAKLAIILSCQDKGLMRFYADDSTRKAVESITLKAGFCNTHNRASPRNN
jgi:hypothetical protein